MSFSLGNMLSTAWDIGKDFLFGSPATYFPSGKPGSQATHLGQIFGDT